jgi:hypothetical protein
LMRGMTSLFCNRVFSFFPSITTISDIRKTLPR